MDCAKAHEMRPAPPRSSIDVSVIVAACNAQEYLGEALRSALAQADVEVEILIVDDASTDRTRQIAEHHAGRDPRIRVIRSERRRGPGAARNLALDQSQGQWIAVLDADDSYHVDRLASLLAIARDWKADMVADNLWLVDALSGRSFDLMFRSEEHTSELQSLMRISYPVFCSKKKTIQQTA